MIDNAIAACQLDLSGLAVLTEAASGVFATTCLIAARAGADHVFAVTRTSRHGEAHSVIAYCRELAAGLGVAEKITLSDLPPLAFANRADIVTNLGFVRPINAELIARLPPHSVIALMWEPWEYRKEDVDLNACQAFGIPLIGTRETDPRLRTFEYVGTLALKLVLESGLEVLRTRVAIIGSDPFGSAVEDLLRASGAETLRLELTDHEGADLDASLGNRLNDIDALVLVEHRNRRQLMGTTGGIDPRRLAESDIRLIHICGCVDDDEVERAGLKKWPGIRVSPGFMTVATDYLGPRPGIDLHCAGLRVGEAAARARIAGATVAEAVAAAEATGLGLKMPQPH